MFGCDQNKLIKKSFDKHGYIMILGGIRQENTYIHGIQKQYTRLHKFDFYSPVFQALGEQPVYKYEIYTQNSEENTNIFGYLPA
jgi:aminoglycoside N3'-acetyltransferase